MLRWLVPFVLLGGPISAVAEPSVAPSRRAHAEYRAVQEHLAQGWNTWHNRSVLSHVLLPEGLVLNLAFKQHRWLDEPYLREALIGRRGEASERITPGLHAWDGAYSSLRLRWQQLDVTIESAHDGDDVVILVTPEGPTELPVKLVLESGFLWNQPGAVEHAGGHLRARMGERVIDIFATAAAVDDPYVETLTPHRVMIVDGAIGIATGRARSIETIRRLIDRQRATLVDGVEARYGDLAEAYLALMSGIAWNTIYEPLHERVISTVGRLWNVEYGGFSLFGWDNFFLAYATSLDQRELAIANVIEHLHGLTEEGFIPNDHGGNGRKSWDHSQPPVGSIMVREVYRRYPERWFLESTFDALLAWNRWWPKRRLNQGLLSYGSHAAKNPFREGHRQSMIAAGYESGMDDSPMYEGVPFDPASNTMALQDVGLNSLYIADCRALAELASVLGKASERRELDARADAFAARMADLWHEETGLYLNHRTDTGEPSQRLSPTLFYPLLARVPDAPRAARMVNEHLLDPAIFWGEHILPSIARNDPAFPRQRYWKGAIWPPLNFLTYLSLRNYGFEEARATLAERSLAMFLREWRRKGYVSENYSSITGTGDDERLSSDPFHSWGVLFGLLAFIDRGILSPPEAPLTESRSR